MALFKQDMSLLSGPTVISGSSNAGSTCQSAIGVRAVYPLTSSQEGIWVEYVIDPLSTKYNLTLEWDLSNGERSWDSTSTVFRAIRRLTERHSVLRSVISVLDGKAHVEEHDPQAAEPVVRIVFCESSSVTESSVTTILRQPFNLREEYPARWVVLQDASTYRVFLVGHHIAVDGGSMSILSQEFLELMENRNANLPLPVDFSRMHLFERAWRRTPVYKSNESFFMGQLRNQRQAGNIAERQSGRTTGSEEYRRIQSWSTFSKKDLEEWGSSYRTSWFRIAVSLVGLLVMDQTRPPLGEDEVLAVAFAGRPKDFQRCVGQFANALPVQVPLWKCLLESPQSTLQSLVKAVSSNVSQAKRAELFPPIEVARCSRARNIQYQPPKVAVTYSPKLARQECQLFPVEGAWDLFFCFLEYENDVKLGVIYDPSLFPESVLGSMRSQFESLIELSKSPTTKLTDTLPWIPAHPSVPRLLADESLGRPHRHVHHWFDAHAELNPNKIALFSAELKTSVTYGELYESSEEKSILLRRKGVCPGDTVVINLQRGLHVIDWILAILKAGAAFVYLDPDLAEARREAIMSNCQPTLVVDGQFEDMSYNWVFVNGTSDDDESTSDGSTSDTETKWATQDSDLAYIIYTSGSTGEPKGVMVEHGNLSSFVNATKDVFKVGYGARVLQLASFSFDASVLEWTMALCTGSCLCFAKHPKQLVGDYLADVIEQNQVTFMEITPTALETLPITRDVTSLRQISIGGEAGSRKLFETWHSRVDLVNAYGPTEGAIAVCYEKIDKGDALPEIISAGKANPGTKIYISNDSFTRILGSGQEGEVCFSGDQVVRGYRGKPELTAEKFRQHPANGVHMYRTGDRGVLLEDGSLVLLGRMDRELKLRGFRIAPEEVEKAIMGSGTGFTEASVYLSDDGLALEAFVAPLTFSTEDLSRALKSMVPVYMVPGIFHQVESLPKNASGKIDHKSVYALRGSLKGPELVKRKDSLLESDEDSDDYYSDVETQGEEAAVTEIWQTVLGFSKPPKTNVNFFDIGGHSLLVPRLNEKLRQQFPLSTFRMVDLFHQSTIEQQAALITPSKSISKPRRRLTRSRKQPAAPLTPPSPLSAPASALNRNTTITTTTTTTNPNQTDVAIIGLSGRFPGAQDADAFYEQLLRGYNGITPSTSCRTKTTLPGNIWVAQAGTLSDIEAFDHRFFNLSAEDATDMDPQQRLFLEVAHEALADAGIATTTREGRGVMTNATRIGVFVGAAQHAYHLHTESVVKDAFERENRGFTAPSLSARTAYHLNLAGPNVTVQTNCASSTVALSLAMDEIALGRCDVAVVGGVSVQLFDGGYITQPGQIFSAKGECRPFDSRADGTVPADAVVAVVLKRFSDAVSDRTPMYAKVLGTGIGSDGGMEKAGFQVPSPRGQAEVIKQAWKKVGVPVDRLVYSELHGSGTPIGDALELQGLTLALRELGRTSDRPWTVGSVKGNIGNTQHASGLVSLVKLCKSMQRGIIPATAGLEKPNQMIDPSLPIRFAVEQTPLRENDVVSISAAGWGGVNSHVVLTPAPARLLKTSSLRPQADKYQRQQLRAPRIKTERANDDALVRATAAIISRCASEIFERDVGPHENLYEVGLDSKTYVSLTGSVAKMLETDRSIGIAGLILPDCTPTNLARLYVEQLASTSGNYGLIPSSSSAPSTSGSPSPQSTSTAAADSMSEPEPSSPAPAADMSDSVTASSPSNPAC
ncbi:Hybrid PKS-NRPS synthetase TAS1 [Lasiodiplodia theobromae]|uniref:Hybrid PKS-NRPS synthetase TAS1 n=1 Tax=Lasiodiplodia theobromae TaxID=45133 RepID=A0A5N5D6H7_9PEZI|nr:Hybrid PKS-NRPS synthetase TAS1 [Lasiodiplodia theobromae]